MKTLKERAGDRINSPTTTRRDKAAKHLHQFNQQLTPFHKATSFRAKRMLATIESVRYMGETRKGTLNHRKKTDQFRGRDGSRAIHRDSVDCSAKTARTENHRYGMK